MLIVSNTIKCARLRTGDFHFDCRQLKFLQLCVCVCVCVRNVVTRLTPGYTRFARSRNIQKDKHRTEKIIQHNIFANSRLRACHVRNSNDIRCVFCDVVLSQMECDKKNIEQILFTIVCMVVACHLRSPKITSLLCA